jgi:hypothetical protein
MDCLLFCRGPRTCQGSEVGVPSGFRLQVTVIVECSKALGGGFGLVRSRRSHVLSSERPTTVTSRSRNAPVPSRAWIVRLNAPPKGGHDPYPLAPAQGLPTAGVNLAGLDQRLDFIELADSPRLVLAREPNLHPDRPVRLAASAAPSLSAWSCRQPGSCMVGGYKHCDASRMGNAIAKNLRLALAQPCPSVLATTFRVTQTLFSTRVLRLITAIVDLRQ